MCMPRLQVQHLWRCLLRKVKGLTRAAVPRRIGSAVINCGRASELAPDLHGAVHVVVREHIHAGQVSGFDHRHLQPPGGDDSRLVLVLYRLRLGLRLARDVDHKPATRFVGLASVGSVEVECFLAAPLLFLEAIVE